MGSLPTDLRSGCPTDEPTSDSSPIASPHGARVFWSAGYQIPKDSRDQDDERSENQIGDWEFGIWNPHLVAADRPRQGVVAPSRSPGGRNGLAITPWVFHFNRSGSTWSKV
jgi:hypothetical protein